MMTISEKALEKRREQYAPGTRVELVSMSDPYTKLKPGERGSVKEVDDTGTIFVSWDSGSGLGVVYGVDEIKLVPPVPEDVREQIMAIRKMPGCPNMFDCNAVQVFAALRYST